MGHLRVGYLPRTKKWEAIIQQMASSSSKDDTSRLIENTSVAAQKSLTRLETNEGVEASFSFLLQLATSSRDAKRVEDLVGTGLLEQGDSSTPIDLMASLNRSLENVAGSKELIGLAQGAAADTLVSWWRTSQDRETSLFEASPDPLLPWKRAATPAGFCEIARIFFGKLTERHLRYYLDREAGSALGDVEERDNFRKRLNEEVDTISQYAFETAKITQSFAAGWFTTHAKQGMPGRNEILGFMSHAFDKLREEIRREAAESGR
jgi:hypothetical protein